MIIRYNGKNVSADDLNKIFENIHDSTITAISLGLEQAEIRMEYKGTHARICFHGIDRIDVDKFSTVYGNIVLSAEIITGQGFAALLSALSRDVQSLFDRDRSGDFNDPIIRNIEDGKCFCFVMDSSIGASIYGIAKDIELTIELHARADCKPNETL